MTAYYVGSLELGAAIPTLLAAQASITVSVGVSLPEVTARLDGWIALHANLLLTPPSFAGQVTAVADLLAQLQLSATLGLPDVDFQVSAALVAIAELEGILAGLSAQLDFAATLQLGVGGIHFYRVESTSDQVGADLAAVLSAGIPGAPPGTQAYGVLMVGTTPQARAALEVTLA